MAQVGLLSALRVVGPWYPHLSAYVIIRNFGTLLAVIFIYTLCPDGSPKTPSTEMQQRGPGPEGAPHPALLTPLNSNRRPVSNNAQFIATATVARYLITPIHSRARASVTGVVWPSR